MTIQKNRAKFNLNGVFLISSKGWYLESQPDLKMYSFFLTTCEIVRTNLDTPNRTSVMDKKTLAQINKS